ncbi:uncharacterized protein BX663DRAFT_513683 [Cokeromyces recurvatus]|uniref:uncharacterized protein n=1 Tax=Cokeromyces recurvatus TaxID=90255 RepID=UPI00221F3159|nr:uncharacterized protein BX663DRAFT_513683 [Cokeromyces recurvatus]KAI7901687.1 hypothetical protein BX663DRAFT_513683 [Cokeromyces recurvatus]
MEFGKANSNNLTKPRSLFTVSSISNDSFTWSHTIVSLNMHRQLQMLSIMVSPLSFLLY